MQRLHGRKVGPSLGTPGTPKTLRPVEPQDLRTLGKSPSTFEYQNLNN